MLTSPKDFNAEIGYFGLNITFINVLTNSINHQIIFGIYLSTKRANLVNKWSERHTYHQKIVEKHDF